MSTPELTHQMPDIELPRDSFPQSIPNQESHDELLGYLKARLDSSLSKRSERITRFAAIDRTISTWQMLSDGDAKRRDREDRTGKSQATHMNVPLIHTHVDDMVSFFASVYAPTNGEFFIGADPKLIESQSTLVKQMRADAKQSKYHKQIVGALRSLLKYNIGGVSSRWIESDMDEESIGTYEPDRSLYEALDMYNTLWDVAIVDPARIAAEAEWAASVCVRNRAWFLRRELSGQIAGAGARLNPEGVYGTSVQATYYKNPPINAGIQAMDSKPGNEGQMNWDSYGMSLSADSAVPIQGHEVISMYCWLNPKQFRLQFPGLSFESDTFALWRFLIMDGMRIIQAVPVQRIPEDESVSASEIGTNTQIPFYMGYLNQDDMGPAQRGVAELLKPFQTYGSFLMNSDVDATRSEIGGVTVYDPNMFDFSEWPEGTVTGRLRSKMPGRDVRSGLQRITSDRANSKRDSMQQFQQLMQIVREFFPAQAMPAQIANIDRATTNQVGAVLQGVTRRLQMYLRVMDSDIMGPMRMASYRDNLNHRPQSGTAIDEDTATRLLGSGVQALNNEIVAEQVRTILFALMQNQQAIQEFDIPRFITFWSHLLNIDVDVEQFRRQQQPQPGQEMAGDEGAGIPEGSGLPV